jgi:galactokinase
MPDTLIDRVRRTFRESFGPEEMLVRSPGRVNFIGEHTDYSGGFVLPGAIDKAIYLALGARHDRRCRFRSVDMGQVFEGSLDQLERSELGWPNYLLGVLSELLSRGFTMGGIDCAFGGDLPIGSGLSSSAALESGLALALNQRFGFGLDRAELALLAQHAENRFVGVACGIMDPFSCLLSRNDSLIRLDCRDLSYAYVPFRHPEVRIVLCDTQVRRALASSEYNVRRAQCEAALADLRRRHHGLQSLRDVTLEMLEVSRETLDPVAARRASFVVEENQRVLECCDALGRGDLATCGRLMNLTHQALSKQYEVSSPELDLLQEAAIACPGVLGSRMMGAGFGGCTINLVEEAALDRFQARMAAVYEKELGRPATLHTCRLTGGTEIMGSVPRA